MGLLHVLLFLLPFNFLRVGLLRIIGSKVGKNTFLARTIKYDFPWRLSIGNKSVISANVYLDCRGGSISIGDCSDISIDCKIFTLTHDIHSSSLEIKGSDVTIGERVWICTGAVLLPGSSISDGCVVGANSVFSGASDPNSLYLGIMAKHVKYLNEDRAINVRKK